MSAANNGSWTHVRVRRSTVEALREWAARTDRLYAAGRAVPEPGEQGYSIDYVISLLLQRDDDHRERSRRSRVRKAVLRRLNVPTAAVVDGQG
jgi:hypothetical protein